MDRIRDWRKKFIQSINERNTKLERELNKVTLPINECPHCGCAIFYRKDYMSGSSWYYASNTIDVENGSMYDGLKTTYGKWWHCDDCHKRVFEDEDVE